MVAQSVLERRSICAPDAVVTIEECKQLGSIDFRLSRLKIGGVQVFWRSAQYQEVYQEIHFMQYPIEAQGIRLCHSKLLLCQAKKDFKRISDL